MILGDPLRQDSCGGDSRRNQPRHRSIIALRMGDHDTFFKHVFSAPEHAAGELRSVLPAAVTERMDLEALELVPASFIDEEMQHRHADLLFRAPVDGKAAYVYFLFEHQSEPDPLMPFRILTYMQRIWGRVLKLWSTSMTRPCSRDPSSLFPRSRSGPCATPASGRRSSRASMPGLWSLSASSVAIASSAT